MIFLEKITLDNEELKNMIVEIHKHHNSFDNMFPIEDVYNVSEKHGSIHHYWFIIKDKKHVGFVETKETQEAKTLNLLEINRLFVLEEFRNKNIGEEVLLYMKKFSLKNGYDGICGRVYLDNPAQHLYERVGFQTYYKFITLK